MRTTVHLSNLLLIFCGLLGALSTPVPQTTTINPTTTIGLNDSNSSILTSDEGPVIIAEGDVDVLILNLGGILSEEELANATNGYNASKSNPLLFLGRDIEALAPADEESFLQDEQESDPSNAFFDSSFGESTTFGNTNQNSTALKNDSKRNIGEDILSLFLLSNSPSEESNSSSTTTDATSTTSEEPSTTIKTQKRSVIDEIKIGTHELDKESHKSDPTLSTLISTRSSNNHLGALLTSHSTEPSATSYSSSLKNEPSTSSKNVVLPTFQSIPVQQSNLDNVKTPASC